MAKHLLVAEAVMVANADVVALAVEREEAEAVVSAAREEVVVKEEAAVLAVAREEAVAEAEDVKVVTAVEVSEISLDALVKIKVVTLAEAEDVKVEAAKEDVVLS